MEEMFLSMKYNYTFMEMIETPMDKIDVFIYKIMKQQ